MKVANEMDDVIQGNSLLRKWGVLRSENVQIPGNGLYNANTLRRSSMNGKNILPISGRGEAPDAARDRV